MTALLVTWTIDDPDHEAALHRRLEQFESTRLSATSRVVDTELNAERLFQALETELGQEDRVYIFSLGEGWIGYGYDAINDWLHRHLEAGTRSEGRGSRVDDQR